jgi:hypothetical protein
MIKLTGDQATEIVRMLNSYTEELEDRIDYTDDKDESVVKYLESEVANVESMIDDLEKILTRA